MTEQLDDVKSLASTTNASINDLKPQNTEKCLEILQKRAQLPVWRIRDEFFEGFANNQVVIVVGEPGSGKTTQVPQWCHECMQKSSSTAGNEQPFKVACTQPRKAAAVSAAIRVAEELDVNLGEEVGFSIRFENRSGAKTSLKYMTDSALLRESMSDPSLNSYGCVVLDEIHERTLATDSLMVVLGQLLQKRSDLKLVVMTADPDVGKIQNYFDKASLLTVPVRAHPVEILFAAEQKDDCVKAAEQKNDYVEIAVRKVVEIHRSEKTEGNILVFLADQGDIERACRRIREQVDDSTSAVGTLECIAIHSATCAPSQEIEASKPRSSREVRRKCVISTNTAEVKPYVADTAFVVDSGLAKQVVYDSRTQTESSVTSLINKLTARQRAACAGRAGPVKCFRLYTEDTFRIEMQERSTPEILRGNLATVVLQLKKFGIGVTAHSLFMDPPAAETLTEVLKTLESFGALNLDGTLTDVGKVMADFPLPPQLTKTLISSCDLNCSDEILSIIAMLSVPENFMRSNGRTEAACKAKMKHEYNCGDHVALLNIYEGFKQSPDSAQWCRDNSFDFNLLKQADETRSRLSRIMDQFNLKTTYTDPTTRHCCVNVRKAIVSGCFMQVAHLDQDGHYRAIKDNLVVLLDSSSSLKHQPEWIVYNEHVDATENIIGIASEIEPEWLFALAPQYFDLSNFPESAAKRRLEKIAAEFKTEAIPKF